MLFERELNHWGKGLTGTDLSKSNAHDEIIMIRTIEMNKESIVSDPKILFPGNFTIGKMLHIYENYCATYCTEERDEFGNLIDLPNVSVSLIGEAVDLAYLHS